MWLHRATHIQYDRDAPPGARVGQVLYQSDNLLSLQLSLTLVAHLGNDPTKQTVQSPDLRVLLPQELVDAGPTVPGCLLTHV